MMETTSAHPPPTRYKTLRRSKLLPSSTNASATKLPSVPITPSPQQQTTGDGVSRSRSRYRRRPIVDTTSVPVPIPQIPVDLQQRDHQQVVLPPNSSLLSPQKGLQKVRIPQTVPSNPTSSEKRKLHPQGPVPSTPAAGEANGAFLGKSERKIDVQVGKETLSVVVPIGTEASTLAAAVAKLVPEKTIYNASILLESFKGLGLERPVRKYERIRDIMNSWEGDTKNKLILISSLSGGEGLNLADAPIEPPPESYAWLSYMAKPGKWSKRWIMMRDGAISWAKKDTKKDKEFQHLCHLSDFDIYDPTPTTASNVLKCPKRYCFAVKSQQKASLFQNTSDWVHYFATNDKNIYTTWLNLLRGWRAYYLVQIKGYGKPKEKSSSEDEEGSAAKKKSDDDAPLSRTRTRSRPPTSDTIGSGKKRFTPLISEEELARPAPTVETSLQRTKSQAGTARHRAAATSPTAHEDSNKEVFAPTGLLGRTYTKKVKEMHEAEKEQRKQNVPLFTPASAMANLASNPPVRTFTMKSHRRASSVESALSVQPKSSADAPRTSQPLSREKSVSKHMPKPLLEFSDSEQPPAPRSRYRSRTLVNTNGSAPSGGLISGATGPTSYEAPPLPTSSLWTNSKSRPVTQDKDQHGLLGSPFTGTGLLAHSQEGAGAVSTGHGVTRKGPDGTLLDMRNKSIFVQGSLLAKVDKERPDVPVIDRSLDSD